MLSHRAMAQSGRAGGGIRSVEGDELAPAPGTSRRAAATPATPSWRRTPTPRIAASRAGRGPRPPRASPVPAHGVASWWPACRDGRVVRGGQDGASTFGGLSPPAACPLGWCCRALRVRSGTGAGCARGGRVHPARAEQLARPLRREFPRPVDRLDAERCRWRCQHILPLVKQLGPLAPVPSQH